jgi:DNA-binding CsgD family transcriptional regulator/tetratricopeptide (TPR) repeat protein
LLRRLSVFASGFTLDSAESVCSDKLIDEYAVLDLLSRLVDKSLVQAEHPDEADRYRMLETIRIYARDRLLESGESEAVRTRHCEFFLSLAERAEPELVAADAPAWLARLDLEHDNLRGALEWAEITDAHEQFLRLVTALTLFWELRGHLGAGGRWFARALARDEGPSVVRARALWGAAHVAVYGGVYEIAGQRAPEALAMAGEVGDEWAMARALNTIGFLQLLFEPEPARTELRKSVDLGRKIGDNWAVADGLKMISLAWLFQEDHDGLADALEELRSVAERLENKFFTAWYHSCVGWMALRCGDFALARRELELSIDECRQVGEPSTEGCALSWLSELDALTGDYDAAHARLSAFLQRAAATGGEAAVPFALLTLATLAVGRGHPAEAGAILEPLLPQDRSLGISPVIARGLAVLGSALFAEGQDQAADAALEEAKEFAKGIDNPWLIAVADHRLGRLARRRGQVGTAEDLHHEGLALLVPRGLRPDIVQSLEALAALAADHESFSEATRLFAAAAALRGAIGLARWPADQAEYDGELARARLALGDSVFETAWAEGEALTVEDAVAYATRARGERGRPSSGWASLTPTEMEVVSHAAQGLTNPQIAERMFIARGTVKIHLSHIFAKLGYSTRAELAAEAVRKGIGSTGSNGRRRAT